MLSLTWQYSLISTSLFSATSRIWLRPKKIFPVQRKKKHLNIHAKEIGGPFTPQIILAVVCSCCGGPEKSFNSAQLTSSVLLVVEVTKQFPGPDLAGSRLTKTYVVDRDVKHPIHSNILFAIWLGKHRQWLGK